DGNGNQVTVRDAEGGDVDVLATYDGLGRKVRVRYPTGLAETFTYDAVGNLTGHTDRRGIVFTTDYDDLGRALTQKVKESITNAGQPLPLVTARAEYHDAVGPSGLYEVVEHDANGNQTVKSYDGLGRLTRVDDPDPVGEVVFHYDAVNKLTAT